jgi:8-oxo-dGTP pyrophosphatase MutT (NUDIX family)
VVLVRQGSEDVEVFMVRRSPRSEFAASVYVFPGGSVRADDMAPEAAKAAGLSPERALQVFEGRGSELPPDPVVALGLNVAALRELYEEAGVLLAREPDGRLLDIGAPGRVDRLAAARSDVEEGSRTLAELAVSEHARLAWEELVYFSHWITPRAFPIRFDTRFFLAPLPPDQEALYGPRETTDGIWVSPRQALDRYERGEFPLVFATWSHLARLVGPTTVEDLLRFGREKHVRTLEPSTRSGPQGPEPYLLDNHEGW